MTERVRICELIGKEGADVGLTGTAVRLRERRTAAYICVSG